ncbi:peptidase domain-containing ABC transporter [Azospirillum picis]|uniref:ATP-binding cassette subfamily B protein n=1 Tax=Azospirillum picis TaxID=488438 RepID=A0ABU0MTL4_9PROT|nr:peptidase domain-containing ABC transporter [Azospirillum picis]MBP2303055.1 ATP-binding cassette subfamily B protein [Azospirillum picis]MDQ0536831.1 ATP-binding cassette subfamily B protein [Azospirillum picis]
MPVSGPNSALKCLVEAARLRGIDTSVERIQHDLVLDDREPSTKLLLRAAAHIGLKARAVRMGWRHFGKLDQAFPVIARLRNGNSVLVVGANVVNGVPVVLMHDPLAADAAALPIDEARFTEAWTGEVLLLKQDGAATEEEPPFGFAWFFPMIRQQKRLFRDVGVAAILLSVLTMAMPVFMQIVIDRVLVHRSIDTLHVLIVGMMLAILFETLFSYMRRYLMLYASNKIDAQVSMRTFAKLVSLPIDFFEHASTGVVTKNMQQTERIRQFLTGQVFSVALDCVGLIVFIPMMFLYSVPLAIIVMASTLLLCIMMIAFLPAMKRRMNDVYASEASLQGYLVETIQGMRTIKSLSLDARQRQVWDQKLARAIDNRFRLGSFALVAQSLIQPIDKITQVAVMGLGAYMIFDGSMLVGALIAFRIIAGRVTGPLIQLSQMIQQFQEVSLSLRMLGQIMNHEVEEGRSGRGMRAPIQGEIEFSSVRFTYPGASSPALDRVSFTIQQGHMFGIMGRSGSGKTTVTRLLQALHRPQDGLVKLDGHDLREIDLDHLRTNIGVVLQDNFLFRGTIRENIAAAKPGAPLEEVMEAARLAGADEFIERLPRGFDTMIEEGSANLSGGQRQRIAIARALLINPPILIMDEATSALDAESEAIIQANMQNIAKGRTLIIISHRLSSLVACDSILVLDRGQVADVGRHSELLGRCDVYRHLWYKQNRHLELAS